MFRGSITALVTPFRNGKVDEAAFTRFIEWQISEGTHGIVPVGTTGESPTLDYEEHTRVIELAVATSKKRIPVIAGTGSNSTDEAVELSQYAEKVGADAVLIVTPYYNKPNQEGLYQHFKAINDAINIPIIIYNIPGRSVVDMSVATMARCYELKNIVGVKDATANLARPAQTRVALGPEFCQLSGEDATALGFMAHGGAGCISVASNVAPRLCSELQNACMAGDFKKALAIQDRLMPLYEVLFIETNPAPVKYAVSRLGFGTADMRLPMVPLTEASRRAIDKVLSDLDLVSAKAAE
ncbi:4-hydroxy-tetrahydrodipicolinate synthase [Hyphomicrobium sp.]|jgi:4-hydroxy-tetrahydrodipicolinate synthase|uniref:4-hydroxy-tetrahydrodipicolinate synthase n=1 Tax=Hyphomicrobium sp. TaxID=82 RepID=UPI0035699883